MGDHVATQSVASVISAHADALSRFWRTLWIAFGFDAATMIGGGMLILLKDYKIESSDFWLALGILVAKSILTSLAAYLLRLKKAPAAERERDVLLAESPAAPVDGIPAK